MSFFFTRYKRLNIRITHLMDLKLKNGIERVIYENNLEKKKKKIMV